MGDAYDRFEDARRPVERLFELGNLATDVASDPDRLAEVKEEVARLFWPDAEHVTRSGTLLGAQKMISDWEVQLERFAISWESLQLFDAGDAVVAVGRILRRSRDDPGAYVDEPTAAAVYRVRGGRIAFFEGYFDARDAFAAAGLDPSKAPGRPASSAT